MKEKHAVLTTSLLKIVYMHALTNMYPKLWQVDFVEGQLASLFTGKEFDQHNTLAITRADNNTWETIAISDYRVIYLSAG